MALVQSTGKAGDVKIVDEKQTTLTIVQDFPKKPVEHTHAKNVEMVQGKAEAKSGDIAIVDDAHKTTLTIAQDFPKKKADHSHAKNIEMVQGEAEKHKEKNIDMGHTFTEEKNKEKKHAPESFAMLLGNKLSQARNYLRGLIGLH